MAPTTHRSIEEIVYGALRDPERALRELDRLDAQDSLLSFIRMVWSCIEPDSQPLRVGWALEAICDHLEAVTRGDIKRLLINVPPGTSKSVCTNVYWPAWLWGPKNRPDLKFIASSYSIELTVRDNRRTRRLMESELYQALWGDRFAFLKDTEKYFENNKHGFKEATSVGGSTTGKRGNIFVIDDPLPVKGVESEAKRVESVRYVSETVPSRFVDPKDARVVMIMQRVHQDDPSGHVLEHGLFDAHLCLPMEFRASRVCPCKGKVPCSTANETPIGFSDPRVVDGELLDPSRYDRSTVEDLKKQLRSDGGDYAVASQLDQDPIPRGGAMFHTDKIVYLDSVPKMARVVRGWDFAASVGVRADWTVGTLIGIDVDGRVVILDVERFQSEDIEPRIKAVANRDGFGVPISIPQDPGQAGKVQRTALVRALHGYTVHYSPESGDKATRASPLASQCNGGNLCMVRAPWNHTWVSEVQYFPVGRTDDQVDSASRGYAYLIQRAEQHFGAPAQSFAGQSWASRY